MLTFNVSRLLKLKGIQSPTAFFMSLGYTKWQSFRMTRDNLSILTIDKIEKLCVALKCSPNDLFHFYPNPSKPLPHDHPLNTLVRYDNTQKITDLLQDLPMETIIEIVEQAKSKSRPQ